MPNKPLLIFPTPTTTGRRKKPSFSSPVQYPTFDRQKQRLEPKFEGIERTFETRRAELLAQPTGAIPEQVLVLETVGSVDDFVTAVRSIPGMEWLGEWDEEYIPPDNDFYSDEEHREKLLSGRLYLVMTNQTAIAELLSMWERYKADPAVVLQHGRAKWKRMFQLLREIRPWGPEDRLLDTGVLHDWKMRITKGFELVRFETELWYKENETARNHSSEVIRQLLSEKGGTLIKQAVINEIGYHGILAELPINAIREIIDNQNTKLVRCDQVMFFRPSGQAAVGIPQDDPLPGVDMQELSNPSGSPIIALLDGLPIENHDLLVGRLLIDDPDNWGSDYPAHERCHGTAMASLIVHDELDSGQASLNTPLYVRPILRPDSRDWRETRAESVPENELPVDLVHRAVKRMIEGERGEPPVVPTVKIVNLSICDPSRPMITYLSPWARLLDWLAWRYNLLFVVSVGNQVEDIELNTEREAIRNLGAQELESEVIRSIASNYMSRRILSPSESINALSIGGSHEDLSPARAFSPLINPLSSANMPSPINSLGLGFRRSIKPDVIYRSGKQIFLEKPGNTHEKAILQVSHTSLSPGQRAASPGRLAGDLSATRHSRGTSNATALTSRIAAQLYGVLDNFRQGSTEEAIGEQYIPVLLKALTVHSASWGETQGILEDLLRPISQPRKLRENISRFLGYGHIRPDRVYSCTDQRVTLMGFSSIGHDEGHLYSVPLPPGLSGQRLWRRLIITLAWLTPINPSHRAYRKAALSFDTPKEVLQQLLVSREESDNNAVKRGTVQHEIFEGEKASVFAEGDKLEIQVNCRADAGDLADTVPYAIVATLEIAEGIDIPIYNEILTRIRPVVPIRPTPI